LSLAERSKGELEAAAAQAAAEAAQAQASALQAQARHSDETLAQLRAELERLQASAGHPISPLYLPYISLISRA